MNISKQANSDEEDLEAVDEEKKANQIFHWDSDAEEEDEEPEPQRGITPFLCGVSPAGVLQAKTKPVGSPALGLIQVRIRLLSASTLFIYRSSVIVPQSSQINTNTSLLTWTGKR